MTTKDKDFLLRVLCSGLSLNKKFRQYCKARWEENTAGLITADQENIKEFFPEFPELYDYFFGLRDIMDPIYPLNERYLDVPEMLSLKKDLETLVMPFGFSKGLTTEKFMDVFSIDLVSDNYYDKSYFKTLLEKAWMEIKVERERYWTGDLFYMSGGTMSLVTDPDNSDRYIVVILDEL